MSIGLMSAARTIKLRDERDRAMSSPHPFSPLRTDLTTSFTPRWICRAFEPAKSASDPVAHAEANEPFFTVRRTRLASLCWASG